MKILGQRARVDGNGIQPNVENVGKSALGRTRHGETRPKRRGASVVQEALGLCSVSSGAEIDEPLWKDHGQLLKTLLKLQRGEHPNAKG